MTRHNRKGPTVAEVKIRRPDTMEERTIDEAALPFFVNQGFEVLTDKGNVSSSATAAAKKE